MRITAINGSRIVCAKEKGDRIYSENALLHAIKVQLNAKKLKKGQKHDLIKKRIASDTKFGHLFGHDKQTYLRTRNEKVDGPHIFIYNGDWAIRDSHEPFNEFSEVTLNVTEDIFGVQSTEK